jgi:dihydropteroate synthase
MLFQKNDRRFYNKKATINLGGELISIEHPLVMGILNITPDSFYDGGKYRRESEIISRAAEIVEQGGAIIDIGAVSTQPGAAETSEEEEKRRLVPAVLAIKKHFPNHAISIDTFRSSVVRRVVGEIGPCIVNDISGGTMDDLMFETVVELGVPYILMHIKGTPATMQNNPVYEDVVKEIILFLAERVNKLKLLGVNDIIIDPGFGFGKNIQHNYELMNRLDAFKIFELPLVAGVSRKAMIWRYLGITPEDALNGTSVLNTLALMGGADILRVHDVREAIETIRIITKIKDESK